MGIESIYDVSCNNKHCRIILYLVNTLLYRMTADRQIDAVITVVSLIGGSLGIVISILIFDGKSEKRNP